MATKYVEIGNGNTWAAMIFRNCLFHNARCEQEKAQRWVSRTRSRTRNGDGRFYHLNNLFSIQRTTTPSRVVVNNLRARLGELS